jgi:N-acetylglucosaminyl-diphospho-decaprenol L-rhamnosyltransferase
VSDAAATAAPDAVASRRPGLTSVVIVAADSGSALGVCVAGALASSAAVEVIVVDNDSRDASVDAAASRFSGDARLRIMRNARNFGFGSGCNRGAAVAAGDALLFLNPDCEIEAGVIQRLRAQFTPDIGLLGVAIVDAAGTPEPASRRRDPTLRRSLMTLSGLARFEARSSIFAGVMLPLPAGRGLEPVDAVSGALMLLPRAVFDQIGGFDEGYFLHAEDFDLCRRVRDCGHRVACDNSITVTHGKGGSSRHRPLFVAWHKHRGMWRWFVKFDPAARNPLLRGIVWTGLWLHFTVRAPFLAWRQWRASRQR